MSFLKRIFSCCMSAPAEDTTSEQRERSNSATQVHHPPQMQRRNSYASDFYQPENIIGHTGDMHSNPTVYYQREEQGGQQSYGHITTVHKKPDNVGKELVRTSSQYRMTHEGVSRSTGNTGTLQEWDYNLKSHEPIHKSRNKFVAVKSPEDRQTLQQATQGHRNKKGRY